MGHRSTAIDGMIQEVGRFPQHGRRHRLQPIQGPQQDQRGLLPFTHARHRQRPVLDTVQQRGMLGESIDKAREATRRVLHLACHVAIHTVQTIEQVFDSKVSNSS